MLADVAHEIDRAQLVSQSALLSSRAGATARSKSRNRASCARIPSTFASTCSTEQQLALYRLAAGIADESRPAADEGDWRVAVTLQCAPAPSCQQRPTCRLSAVGSKPI